MVWLAHVKTVMNSLLLSKPQETQKKGGEVFLKPHRWLLSPLLSFFIVGLTLGQTNAANIRYQPGNRPRPSLPSSPVEQTYPTNVRYQSVRQFPSLPKKIGSILGIAPFKDDRSDKLYVGHQTTLQRVSNYFKIEPLPLEKAISDSLSKAISRSGVKTVPIHNWDGKAESLKNMEADSILSIELKRFWVEGITAGRGTRMITSIYLVIHLGVKKEGKVFARNVYVMKERTVAVLIPDEVEQTLNQNLSRILDDFFSNPY